MQSICISQICAGIATNGHFGKSTPQKQFNRDLKHM